MRARSIVPLDAVLEDTRIAPAPMDTGPLEIRFQAGNKAGTPLIVIANLATANETILAQPGDPRVRQRRPAIDETARNDMRRIKGVGRECDRIEERCGDGGGAG